MERYDASPSASIALTLFPLTALDTAYRTPEVVNTLVDRPRHDAIVKGLNRNLNRQYCLSRSTLSVPCGNSNPVPFDILPQGRM